MKLTFPAVIVTLLSAAIYPLCLPAFGQEDIWNPPPLGEIQQPKSEVEAGSGDLLSNYVPLNTSLKIVSPAPNATLRGVVTVKLGGLEKGGYAIFKLDDVFAYATAYPYTMRWDSQSAQDGKHVIQITGYSGSGQISGVTSITVTVKNQIPISSLGGEIALTVRSQPGATLVREIEAVSSVAGLGGDTVLPENLLALKSVLFARMGQSVTGAAPGGLSDIRSTIRQGSLTADSKELPFQENGFYGIFGQSSSGLAIPPSADSRRPRIGLAEISIELPKGKVGEGTTWVAPMRVVPDLVQRNSLQVAGTHTFDGIWWMQNRKCARISSSYEISEVALIDTTAPLPEPMENPAIPNPPDFSQSQSPGLFSDLPGLLGEETPATPDQAGSFPLSQGNVARLTGLAGTRITWIDIEKGIVVRTEDDITGIFVLPSSGSGRDTDITGADTASLQQRLPYNLSLTEALTK